MEKYETTSSTCASTVHVRAATACNGFGAGSRVRVQGELRSPAAMPANRIFVDVAATGPQVWSPPV
jgi:hypothetical protein